MFHRELGQNRSDGRAVVFNREDYADSGGDDRCVVPHEFGPRSCGASLQPWNDDAYRTVVIAWSPVSEGRHSWSCLLGSAAVAGSATQSQNVDREIRFIRVICG